MGRKMFHAQQQGSPKAGQQEMVGTEMFMKKLNLKRGTVCSQDPLTRTCCLCPSFRLQRANIRKKSSAQIPLTSQFRGCCNIELFSSSDTGTLLFYRWNCLFFQENDPDRRLCSRTTPCTAACPVCYLLLGSEIGSSRSMEIWWIKLSWECITTNIPLSSILTQTTAPEGGNTLWTGSVRTPSDKPPTDLHLSVFCSPLDNTLSSHAYLQADRGLKRDAEPTALKLIPRSDPVVFQELHYKYIHLISH